MPNTALRPTRERAALSRADARAGFRQIQLWVPDTRSAQFAEECRRQSLLIANDPAEQVIMDELEALQDTNGWRS